MDDVPAARSRVSARPRPRQGAPSRRLKDRLPGAGGTALKVAGALAWRGRALLACGVLAATLLWSGPLAGDQIDEALALVAEERYPEAREALQALLEREPDAPRVRVLHGILLAREGNFVDAIAVFEGLRDEHPDMFEAYNNLAVLYAGLGRLDDSRRALIAALKLRTDAVVYANLGDVYMRLAQRAYTRARELSLEDAAATEPGGGDAAAVYPVKPGESFAAPVELPAAATTEDGEQEPVGAATPVESSAAATTEDGEQEPVAAAQEAEGAGGSPPASADPVGAASADAADAVCVRAGTFEDLLTATEAAEWVQTHGARVLAIRHEQNETFSNYRVYLPAASSREAAAATVGELRDRGVSDVAVILKGPLTNAVSFGVFRNEANMRRRVAALEALGYSVSTVANTKVEDEFAIEARADGDGTAFDDAWTAAFPEQPFRRIDCDDRR